MLAVNDTINCCRTITAVTLARKKVLRHETDLRVAWNNLISSEDSRMFSKRRMTIAVNRDFYRCGLSPAVWRLEVRKTRLTINGTHAFRWCDFNPMKISVSWYFWDVLCTRPNRSSGKKRWLIKWRSVLLYANIKLRSNFFFNLYFIFFRGNHTDASQTVVEDATVPSGRNFSRSSLFSIRWRVEGRAWYLQLVEKETWRDRVTQETCLYLLQYFRVTIVI